MHVGIDLGTTFSSVAYYDRNKKKPVIIKNSYGNSGTPSVLCFNEDGVVYGEDAKEAQSFGEQNSIAFFKRNMGEANFLVEFWGQSYNAEGLSAILLEKLIKEASKTLGQPITEAVITVPAYFDNHQREATINAGKKAGVNVLRIINEPTAAAIAYGLNNTLDTKNVLVYDLGGGTFDVTAVRITPEEIIVLGTDGDHQLGGKNWDDAVAEYFAQQFLDEYGVDILEATDDYYELLIKAEKAKKELSARNQTNLTIANQGDKATYTLTLELFNEITRDLMERTKMMCDNLIAEIGFSWQDFEGVLLVGGSTRMKMVHDFVSEMSGKPPMMGIDVDEAVALGAAIQAEIDVCAKNEPTLTLGSAPVLFTLGSKKITDVASHSLGMVSVSEDRTKFINTILIPKNNPIPSNNTKPFKIVSKYHRNGEAEVYILQGENENPLDCSILGRYVISGIDISTAKDIILDIRYDYTLNGVVKVSATQRDTSKSLTVLVETVPSDMSWLALAPDSEQLRKPEPISVVLSFDLSGSMSGGPLAEAKKAAKKLVDNLDMSGSSVSIVGFADSVKVYCELVQNPKKAYEAIDSMSIGNVGGGNSTHPFGWAMTILHKDKAKKFHILLTDGCWSCQSEAIRVANDCKKADIETIAIGFGGADKNFLQAVASTDENALMTSLESLTQSFANIAQVITERSTAKGMRFFG